VAVSGSAQSFTIGKATLRITANNANRAYGAANPTFTDTITGYVNGDTSSVVSGAASLTTTATTTSAPGTYAITVAAGTLSANNYSFSYVNGTLTVTQATPTVQISNIPSGAIYGGNLTVTYTYSGTGSPTESVVSTTTSICTVSGNTVSFVGVGTCTLQASATSTTDDVAVTGSAQSFTVGQTTPSININNLPSTPLYQGSFTAAYTYSGTGAPMESVTSSTTSVCTASGSIVSFVGVGTCTLQAHATSTTDDVAVTGSAQSITVIAYDVGTVALSIGGTQVASTSYGETSTSSSIAAALAGSYSSATVKAVDNILYIESSTTGTDPSYSLNVTSSYPTIFGTPSFAGSPSSGTLEGGSASGGSAKTVYSYSLSYDPGSRVSGYSDAVMGTWSSISYDSLNRLLNMHNTAVSSASSAYSGMYLCWSYDIYGNRTAQSLQTSACPSSLTATASYNANNQISWTTVNGAVNGFSYDASGDVTNDNASQYLYDGEGRVCAVKNLLVGVMTGYIYDAEGNRVSKGSITSMSCNPSSNGFKPMSDYVVGPSGEQVSELGMDSNGTMAWQHTNVWAGGQMIGTYDPNGLHFYANDWLGSRRVQTDYAGVAEQTCTSLPFGDSLSCSDSTSTPTEHHFTAKERDTESGNDYFGARYYSSTMGRFLSPDPSGLVFADPTNPQSLNLYSYAWNNPLRNIDPSGMECVWDDGSYDSADDPDTGSSDKCSGQGGTWIDPDLFENALLTNGQNANIQYGSWSGQANSTIASSWLGASSTTIGPTGAELDAVDSYVNDVNNNLGLQSGFTAVDVWTWAAKPRTPNGPRNWKALPASLYYHGNYCGAGGTGDPVDGLDASCMVHDFFYDKYGYSMGSNFQNPFSDLDPDPTLQKINQGLCDGASTAGGFSGGAVQGYFTYGVTPITGGSGVGCH